MINNKEGTTYEETLNCLMLWTLNQSINQSINQFISRHSTEARFKCRLCWIKEKCLKTDLKCVNGWNISTVQWKRVPEFRSSNRETTSSKRRAAVSKLCGGTDRSFCVDDRSKRDWLYGLIEERRNRQDLIEVFNMCKELLRLKTNELFTLDYNVRRTRGYFSVHTGLLQVFFLIE